MRHIIFRKSKMKKCVRYLVRQFSKAKSVSHSYLSPPYDEIRNYQYEFQLCEKILAVESCCNESQSLMAFGFN